MSTIVASACANDVSNDPAELGSMESALRRAPDIDDDPWEPPPDDDPPIVIDTPPPVILDGGVAVDPSCPISWHPNALTPVFYGYRDYGPSQGAPVAMRVFFPSLDGSPQYGAFLSDCGRYPVILFAHGQCLSDANHSRAWFQLPAQLARAGYVVVVPELPSMTQVPSPTHPALNAMDSALAWLRGNWENRGSLSTKTGVAGHSYGGLLAAEYARTRTVAGYAAVGADWHSWSGTYPIFSINKPKLVLWGGNEIFSQLTTQQWDALTVPKHRAVFNQGAHWDYLPAGVSSCHQTAGTCTLIPSATADLLTMFFAKHMPPDAVSDLPSRVPSSLFPPTLSLTFEQQFYAGGYLNGMRNMGSVPGCEYGLTALLTPPPPPPPPVAIVPDVRELGSNYARTAVLAAGLTPVFVGNGTWVYSQSPRAGAQVAGGSTVTLTLRSGPRP